MKRQYTIFQKLLLTDVYSTDFMSRKQPELYFLSSRVDSKKQLCHGYFPE